MSSGSLYELNPQIWFEFGYFSTDSLWEGQEMKSSKICSMTWTKFDLDQVIKTNCVQSGIGLIFE